MFVAVWADWVSLFFGDSGEVGDVDFFDVDGEWLFSHASIDGDVVSSGELADDGAELFGGFVGGAVDGSGVVFNGEDDVSSWYGVGWFGDGGFDDS